jgi:D-alanine-D-alanine ligase
VTKVAFTVDELKTKRIGMLMGGLSTEREVSLRTGEACAEALESKGYAVIRIDAQKDVAAKLIEHKIEVAFNALHGRWGEDGCIQGLLESMFIPYSGSGVLASALGMDKLASRQVFSSNGIPTPTYLSFPTFTAFERHGFTVPFGFPAVVKPTGEGSSVGVTIVRDQDALRAAALSMARFKGAILVERYLRGREIQVGILDDEILGAIEVVPFGEFYDYDAKYKSKKTKYLYPAPIPSHQNRLICDLAYAAHHVLGCRGATRSDFILEETGAVSLLEINTLPGMTAASNLPKIAAGKGIDFPTLCERLLKGASLKG